MACVACTLQSPYKRVSTESACNCTNPITFLHSMDLGIFIIHLSHCFGERNTQSGSKVDNVVKLCAGGFSTAVQTLKAQAELQSQREQVSRLQEEMSALQSRYEDKCSDLSSFLRQYEEKSKESEEAKMQLQAERLGNR